MLNGMTMTRKKYYILYKVKRNTDTSIKDIEYLNEYTSITDIVKDYHIHFYNAKDIINKSYTEDLKTFKDYTIIEDIELNC